MFANDGLQFWYNNIILSFDKDGYEKLPLIIFDFNWFVRCALIICKAYQSWHLGTTPFAMIGFTTNYVLWKYLSEEYIDVEIFAEFSNLQTLEIWLFMML